MIWFKSVLAGLVAAVTTLIMIVIATTAAFISMTHGAGSGGIAMVSVGVPELLLFPTVVALALGFWWMLRRQRRRLSNESKETPLA